MRIAIAGATGRIGALTAAVLEQDGHRVVPISRAEGVNVHTGVGLPEALAGVDAVIDVINCTATSKQENVAFFSTATNNLLAAEREAGVAHHVALSIAGVQRVQGNAHYAGKRAQEAAIEAGQVPYTIVPATQFHDFAEMIAGWTETDGVAVLPPLLIQPTAPADVAQVLARVATGAPRGRHVDIAGPDPQDLVDMARRTLAVRGRSIDLVPSWHSGIFGVEMAGDVLLAAADAEITPTSFDAWLAAEAEGGSEG